MRLMIVDDERLAADHLLHTLSTLDPAGQHRAFCSTREALDYASTYRLDVVFLDIEMPVMNGLSLARHILEIAPLTNIIFTTAYTQYALAAHDCFASAYLLKPVRKEDVQRALQHLRFPLSPASIDGHRMRVQAFGNFEVFVDDKPVAFRRRKTKELFAYLVDRNGAAVTSAEIAAVLYEDKAYTRSLRSQVQTLISDMMRTLRNLQLEHVVHKSHNSLCVNVSAFDCDYYAFMNGDANAMNAFKGEYMSNYSWTEFMVGVLAKRSTHQTT